MLSYDTYEGFDLVSAPHKKYNIGAFDGSKYA